MVQHLWGENLHATGPNEILHMDYLSMGPSNISHFTLLALAVTAETGPVVDSLLFWISLFGIPRILVTDMGSHFVNKVLQELTEVFHIEHRSWINGTIERLNREVLATTRVMLSEFQLAHTDWPVLIRLIQSALNSNALPNLGNLSPQEVRGLP